MLENVDKLSIDFIKQLLREEFEIPKIEANHYLIQSCIDTVEKTLAFRESVLTEYKRLGLNIHLDKSTIMRELSKKFDRKEMRKVYTTIINWG